MHNAHRRGDHRSSEMSTDESGRALHALRYYGGLHMKKHIQFSKIITAAFSVFMLPTSVYVVWKCLEIAEHAVASGFAGALPYVTAIIGFVEGTIATIYALYHSNSKAEKKVGATIGRPTLEDAVQGANETQEIYEDEVQEPIPTVNLNIDF